MAAHSEGGPGTHHHPTERNDATMGLNADQLDFTSQHSVQELGQLLQHALGAARAQQVEDIESTSGALARFDDMADIEIAASGRGLVGGGWTVQIYVRDDGAVRHVSLLALGHSTASRIWAGAKSTISMTKSIAKRDEIAAAIR